MAQSFEGFQCTIGGMEAGARQNRNISVPEILALFDDFNTKPIASASIAQVYEAVLDGKKVAVKVARPNIIDKINIDLALINDFKPLVARIGGFGKNINFDEFLDEFRELLNKELNFKNEARNLKRFHEAFENDENVHIPEVYDDYCTESVLVMDYMEGTLVKDLPAMGREQRAKYAHLISSSYLKQVYIDGVYHADPHSANILIMDDGIAYIDFGAVGIIDGELRRNMLNLFYGIYKKKTDIAFEAFLKIANVNKEEINTRKFKVDLDDLIAKQNYTLGERQNDSYATLALKYNLSLPSDFSTLERALILVEGVCLELDPKFNLIDDAKPLINQVMMQRYSPFRAAEYLQLEGDRYLDIFRNLPQGINDVIETIRGYRIEKLEEKTRQIKKDKTIDTLAKYIFLSVILASSAYLAAQPASGISNLGIAGFVTGLLLFGYLFLKNQ
jgi:ubiquinone biosynthesis protein